MIMVNNTMYFHIIFQKKFNYNYRVKQIYKIINIAYIIYHTNSKINCVQILLVLYILFKIHSNILYLLYVSIWINNVICYSFVRIFKKWDWIKTNNSEWDLERSSWTNANCTKLVVIIYLTICYKVYKRYAVTV